MGARRDLPGAAAHSPRAQPTARVCQRRDPRPHAACYEEALFRAAAPPGRYSQPSRRHPKGPGVLTGRAGASAPWSRSDAAHHPWRGRVPPRPMPTPAGRAHVRHGRPGHPLEVAPPRASEGAAARPDSGSGHPRRPGVAGLRPRPVGLPPAQLDHYRPTKIRARLRRWCWGERRKRPGARRPGCQALGHARKRTFDPGRRCRTEQNVVLTKGS